MGISLARKQQELNFLSIGPKKSSSHSVNPIRDRSLLLQMFLRHRAQLFWCDRGDKPGGDASFLSRVRPPLTGQNHEPFSAGLLPFDGKLIFTFS